MSKDEAEISKQEDRRKGKRNTRVEDQGYRFAGMYVFSDEQRKELLKRYQEQMEATRGPDGTLDASKFPPPPPMAVPVFQGEDGKFYLAVERDGKSSAQEIDPKPEFDTQRPNRGGFLNTATLERLRRDFAKASRAHQAQQEAIARAASGVFRVPMDRPPAPAGNGEGGGQGRGGPSLGDQATQAGVSLAQGLAGQALANLMATGGLGGMASSLSLSGLGSMGLQQLTGFATSQLFALWGVDDASSMGEQLAKKLAQDVVGKLQSEIASNLAGQDSLFDEGAFDKFFSGAKPKAALMLIARETDPTDHGGVLKSKATKTLVNGLKPIRTFDEQVCPKSEGSTAHVGGPVREGNPTVLIENQLAARVGHAAICTGVGMDTKLAPPGSNVFIGPLSVAVLPPPKPKLLAQAAGTASQAGSSASAPPSESKDNSEADNAKEEVVPAKEKPSPEEEIAELERKEKELLDKLQAEDPQAFEALTGKGDQSEAATVTDPKTGKTFRVVMREAKIGLSAGLAGAEGGDVVLYLQDVSTGETFVYEGTLSGGGIGVDKLGKPIPVSATYSHGVFTMTLSDGSELPLYARGVSFGLSAGMGYSRGTMEFGNSHFNYDYMVDAGTSDSIGLQLGGGTTITYYKLDYIGSCMPTFWRTLSWSLHMGMPCSPTK